MVYSGGTITGSTASSAIAQLPKALEIIEDVGRMAGDVWVNKYQCKRVAERFMTIGAGLADLGVSVGSCDAQSPNMDYPAFDELLTVLRKGQVLVGKNVQWAGIQGVLTWSDNREAFKEIHGELDTMKARFPFESVSGRFETTTGVKRSVILAEDAEKDLETMKGLSQSTLAQSATTDPKPAALDVDQVVRVVTEKSKAKLMSSRSEPRSGVGGGDLELPSFLQIELSAIDIRDPVRKLEISSGHAAATHGWAVVCEGSWLGCAFAVKVFQSGERRWNNRQLWMEVGALLELRHPHIVRFIGFAQDDALCATLMEMMPERDLRYFMKKQQQRGGGYSSQRPFSRAQELDIITQIARGMLYLHTQGFVHGDLNCSNILVKKHDDYIEVKIGDLRYAQKLGKSSGTAGQGEICAETHHEVRHPRWSPPEALDNYGDANPTDEMLKQADVYSFAMACYEVFTGKLPFQDVRGAALLEKIKAGERPELPGALQHSELKGLIESCWDQDPNERPVFENICHILDIIRSAQPAATKRSSGIANVLSAFRQIPNVGGVLRGWLGGVRERAASAQGVGEAGEDLSSMEVDRQPPGALTPTWCSNTDQKEGREGEGDTMIVDVAIKVPECLKIKPAALKKVRRIGEGSFSKVYKAKWLGCKFAVKRMEKSLSAETISELQQELDFLIQLRHPYIIQMVGFSIDKDDRCLIVMEYMKGSLRDLIKSRLEKRDNRFPFEIQEAVGIITKLAQGMAFLHSRGVTHRDLKAANVLCQERAGFIDVKIVDFGVSQVLAGRANAVLGVGTAFWRAPETLPTDVNKAKDPSDVDLMATDVYSFAMTCYEILTGRVPFYEYNLQSSAYDGVVRGLRPTLPPRLDFGLKALITECWHADPMRRPTFKFICARLDALPHC